MTLVLNESLHLRNLTCVNSLHDLSLDLWDFKLGYLYFAYLKECFVKKMVVWNILGCLYQVYSHQPGVSTSYLTVLWVVKISQSNLVMA